MIKCAVIGLGAISGAHIEGYLAQEARCRVVALSDMRRENITRTIERYNLKAAEYTDYKAMLADEEIELVSICTPPGTHKSIATDCLRAGKHVLLEKPMAPSLAECDEIINEAEKAGRIVSVVAQYRYTGQYYRLKKLLDTEKAGKMLHIAVDALFWRGQPYYYLDWRGRWETEGGGCTLNHAVHFIDQLIWLAGMPRRVAAFMNNVAHDNSEVEDISEAVLQFENGMVGRITSSLLHHGEKQGLSIQTDKGSIGVPFQPLSSKTLENGFPQDAPEQAEILRNEFESVELPQFQGHSGQIDDVLSAIEGKESQYVTGTEARNALELILAIYKSAAAQTIVELPLSPDDPFYRKDTMIAQMPVYHEKKVSVEAFQDNTIKVGGSEFVEKE
ncbi:MAG: Gfo/Idh/MocA family protein [Caldicoprobacterales bacterium]|jgi:UDP-N-acetyl-2-amino-2-deoxyglucuronate dehydrogenase|nr:Gfo/Idh/MocA family oxidoreductase [Clostridiales bacterium]